MTAPDDDDIEDARKAIAESISLPRNQGVKYDAGKPSVHLVPPRALLEVAKGMTLGAKKYSAYNWSSGIEWSRLTSAAMRHLLAHNSGEDIDPDSGLPHLAHAGCCVLMLLEMTMSRPDLDDRDPYLLEIARKGGPK